MKSEHFKFIPLTIHSFMSNYLCKDDPRSLLDRYKDYLEQNRHQHHYGALTDIEAWLENAIIEYNITCNKGL